MAKELVSVRLEQDTRKNIENYADTHDVSQSTAIRRLIEKGLSLEELEATGLTVAATAGDTGNRTKPALRFTDYLANGGFSIMLAGFLVYCLNLFLPFFSLSSIQLVFVTMVFFIGFVCLLASAVVLLAFEVIGMAISSDSFRKFTDIRKLISKT